jgi:hypothetical protein
VDFTVRLLHLIAAETTLMLLWVDYAAELQRKAGLMLNSGTLPVYIFLIYFKKVMLSYIL